MIAITRPAAHRISHWIAPNFSQDGAPAIDRRRLPIIKLSDALAGIFPLPP
jgi:hypothetical protein